MKPLVSSPVTALSGSARVPGDKSGSHRALILGASALGETRVQGLLESDDIMRTAAALRALGAAVEKGRDGAWRIQGRGVGGLAEPSEVLDLGNSGTGVRLLVGLVAGHDFASFFTGDASLVARPMARVAAPLQEMGARVVARSGCRLPLALIGVDDLVPIRYRLPVASAQVKSAILLAGLSAPGYTTVLEPEPTRDHTERMLRHFGATVDEGEDDDGVRTVTLRGQPELGAMTVRIPGDPSAAAFFAVAAACAAEAEVRIEGVGINPLRAGLFRCLEEMEADIRLGNEREQDGEPVADLTVRAAALKGIEVPAHRAPAMIDEYPILSVAAACARGRTIMRGLGELRVKESDRLAAIVQGLTACGVRAEAAGDTLTVEGCGGAPPGGGRVATLLDHRIAMAFLVLGMVAREPVAVDDGSMIATSFPAFVAAMNGLGADIGDLG